MFNHLLFVNTFAARSLPLTPRRRSFWRRNCKNTALPPCCPQPAQPAPSPSLAPLCRPGVGTDTGRSTGQCCGSGAALWAGASGRERGWEQRGRLSPVSCHVGECTGCLSSLKDALKGPVTHTYPFKSGILLSVCLNSNCHTKANIQSY